MSGGPDRSALANGDVRWGWRRPCRAHVAISNGNGMAGSGRLRDVSMSGAFLETGLRIDVHTRIFLSILHFNSSKAAVAAATVVRIAEGGVGIEWLDTAAEPFCERLGCANICTAEQP